MSAKVKVSGAWKDSELRVKVSGAWKNVEKGFIKVAGVWKSFLDALPNWDLTPYNNNASSLYANDSFDFSSTIGGSGSNVVGDITFSEDLTEMYILIFRDSTSTNVNQYSLSTAGDLSSVTNPTAPVQYELYYGDSASNFQSVVFKPDGTKMYVSVAGIGITSVREYDLSTAWDISTASFNQSTSLSEGAASCMAFSDDGFTLYTVDVSFNSVGYQYDLSTAWDISTQSYSGFQDYEFDTEDGIQAIDSMGVKPEGNVMWVFSSLSSSEEIYQYSMTPESILSLNYENVLYSISPETTNSKAMYVNSNGLDFYIVSDQSEATVYHYQIPNP